MSRLEDSTKRDPLRSFFGRVDRSTWDSDSPCEIDGRFDPGIKGSPVSVAKPNARPDRRFVFLGSDCFSLNRARDDLPRTLSARPRKSKKRTFPESRAGRALRRAPAHATVERPHERGLRLLLVGESAGVLPRGLRAAVPGVRRTGVSPDVPTPPPGAPSRRRCDAHCGRARSRAPRADATARRRRPLRWHKRAATVHLASARELPSSRRPRAWSRRLSRASALVNTDAALTGMCFFVFRFPHPADPLPDSHAQVHTANHVARRHARSWLCEHCHNGGGTVRAGSPERGERETHLAGLGGR